MRGFLALAVLALLATACLPSLYDKTYNAETTKLEGQAAQQDAAATAAHDEARKFAAVVYFDTGSSQLSEKGKQELRWFVEKLQPYPEAQVQVQGFADLTGSESGNQKLSDARSQSVAGYLAIQGIGASRLRIKGFSTSSPADSNASAEGRERNRRVEVTVY